MLRTPSVARSGGTRNPLKAFKKGNKDGELAKTAPNTPEDDEPGVTVVANEIDPTTLSASVIEQIVGDHRSSPLRGDHRSYSSRSANVREEKKEDHPVPAGSDDVVSKTLNFFDDMCNLPQVNQIENGTASLSEASSKKHPYLLSHNSAYDDYTSSPSLPSETTGTGNESSANPVARDPRNKKQVDSASGAHNHENFEVVLDPASVIKEMRENPQKPPRGNRLMNISKSFKKKKASPGPSNDDSDGAMQPTAPPARDEADQTPLDEEYGRLLGAENSDEVENVAGVKPEEEKSAEKAPSIVGSKGLAKKIFKLKNFKKATQKEEQKSKTGSDSAEAALEGSNTSEEQVLTQGVAPIVEKEDIGKEPKEKDSSMVKTLNNMICGAADDTSSKPELAEKEVNNISEEDEKNLKALEAMVPMRQSVEIVNKKPSRGANLGRRLKKIQKTAFMAGRKGTKKTKASGSSKPAAPEPSPAPEPLTYDADGVPRKPKQVWKSVVDPNTGRTYYYHRKTRETTWTKPEALDRYEVAYQRWIDATVALQGKEIVSKEEKKTSETKPDEKVQSVPKSVPSITVDNKANETPVVRTSTPVAEKKVQIKETKKEVPVTKKVEKAGVKVTKVPTNKQTIDETKPFDEATPFDEPMAEGNEPGLLFLPRSPPRFGRTMTYTSKASARSALTDRTEKIKNTGKGKFSSFNPIAENPSSTAISTRSRVPSRVPVHRERQLMVEELTDTRLNAESYEGMSGERRGRIVRGRAREVEPTPEAHYDGDNDTDDYGTSTYDNDTYGTDSVSALSENDTDFLSRRDNFDQARRRALDAAIETEDWDLAAALSDGMRAANLPGGYEKAHSSWNQSELDKFIANNDWDAVKSYIARMRDQSKKDVENGNRLTKSHPVNKRVGSRSQMQHNREVMSESSWSGSGSESSYDDETYDSESEI